MSLDSASFLSISMIIILIKISEFGIIVKANREEPQSKERKGMSH